MYIRTIIRIVSLFLSVLLFPVWNCLADIVEIRYDDVFNVVKSCEKKVNGFRWKVKMEIASSPIAGQTNTDRVPAKGQTFADVLLDCHTKRFKVEEKKQTYGMMGDGTVVQYTHEGTTAYDGSSYSAWGKNTPHDRGVRIYQGSAGEITNNLDNSVAAKLFLDGGGLRNVGFRTGIPCFFLPDLIGKDAKFLSEFLAEWKNEGKTMVFFRQDDGDIIIYAGIFPDPIGHYVAKIVYSPSKNGIITEYSTLLSYSKATGDGKFYSRRLTRCEQNQDGDWVPTVVSLSMPFLGPNGYDTEMRYEEFEYLPKISVEDFQVTFPKGTEVSDHVAKMFYKVGDHFDEDFAINEFMERYGFTGDVPSQMGRGGIFRYTFMIIGFALIFIALCRIFLRRWGWL